MTIPDYLLNPVNGYLDSVTYPNPANGAIARTQINDLVFQVLNNLNDYKNKLQITTSGTSGAKQIGFPSIETIDNVTNLEDALIKTMNLPNIIQFPILSSEIGVANARYEYGDIRRYGGHSIDEVGYSNFDSAFAINNAIQSMGIGGKVKIGKNIFLCKSTITLLQWTKLEGLGEYYNTGTGNNPTPCSQLLFDIANGVNAIITDVGSELIGFAIRHITPGNTSVGVYAANYFKANRINIQSFGTGFSLLNNYYSTFEECTCIDCSKGIYATSTYNLKVSRHRFGQCDYPITFTNAVRPANIDNCSFEQFKIAVQVLSSGSDVKFTGNYVETGSLTSPVSKVIYVEGSHIISTIGNQVYLNETDSFIDGFGESGLNINSFGNSFVSVVGSSITPRVYKLPTTGDVNIYGDDLTNYAKGDYVGGSLNSGAVKNVNIIPANNDPTFTKEYNFIGRPTSMVKLTSAPTTPLNGALYFCDGVSWNPLSHTDSQPYYVSYIGGGYRPPIGKMASQSDSVASDVTTLKTDFNSLLAKLRTLGLM